MHHLSIANGSLGELVTHLEACVRLKYLPRDLVNSTFTRITSIAKQLYSLRNSLRRAA